MSDRGERCEHKDFHTAVNIGRLTDGDTGPVRSFMADIRINCKDCGLPFEFMGLQMGMDLQGARMSPDGQEARIAITPSGVKPNPLHRMAFNVSKFDG